MDVTQVAVPQPIAIALTNAGEKNGVDFGYLLQTAMRESSLNPNAKAATSSATGLFQFLESTWLEVMKEQGPSLGYGAYAEAISRTPNGGYTVADAERRAEILNLRKDPQVASDLAAAFTKTNGDYLQARFGRAPSPGELYIAHFLGAQGAERMFTAGLADPDQSAVALFPRQAAANLSIFYENGSPRSVREVYQVLVAKHQSLPPNAAFATQQLAGEPLEAALPEELVPSRFAPGSVSFTALFTDPTGLGALPPAQRPSEGALFSRFYAEPTANP